MARCSSSIVASSRRNRCSSATPPSFISLPFSAWVVSALVVLGSLMNHSHLGTTAASAENLSFRPPESRQQLEEKDENEMKGLAVGCMLALAAMSGALAEDQRNVNVVNATGY